MLLGKQSPAHEVTDISLEPPNNSEVPSQIIFYFNFKAQAKNIAALFPDISQDIEVTFYIFFYINFFAEN